MKKLISLLLVLLLFAAPALASEITVEGAYTDGVYVGEGNGYLGAMKVEVTVAGGKITEIKLVETVDTEAIYKTAVDSVIPAIIEKNTINDVDVQTSATYSSLGIMEAVAAALEQAGATVTRPEVEEVEVEVAVLENGSVYHGMGAVPNFRVGPGKDSEEVPVYSFNVTMASVLFDEEGRILDMQIDIYEVSTPNYDGASMPHFSGWPATEGYNTMDHETEALIGKSENTEELSKAEVNGWLTKRERGADYGMNAQNEWYMQMDAYQQMFIGFTVEEVREWFTAYTSTRNGRPIKPTSENEADVAALAAMTDEEKAMLADVVSSATMSLSDAHGFILEAVEKAWENAKLAAVIE